MDTTQKDNTNQLTATKNDANIAAELQELKLEEEAKPVDQMTDIEIETYYKENDLGGISQSVMTDYQLDVVQRYGVIVSSRRQRVEREGENAALLKVRRKVQEHVNIYGRAQYLTECLQRNYSRLTREEPGEEVGITIHCNGIEVSLGFGEIQAAYAQRNNTQTIEFNRKVNDILNFVKLIQNQAKAKAYKVDGKNYEAMCQDITWKAVVQELNEQFKPEYKP